MIDTIKLKFKYEHKNTFYFQEKIHQRALNLFYATGNRYIWTNNTWRKDRQKQGVYTPKYWIEQDFLNPAKTYFCLETSLPKLLYGENHSIIYEHQLDDTVKALHEFLQTIGVYIFSHQIKSAIPILLAIGKNIHLEKVCPCDLALKALKPFDYKAHSKYRIVDFSDYKYRGKELIFSKGKISSETIKAYDKKREVLNNAKTKEEKEIAKKFEDGGAEILRIELTLKTPRKITAKFKPYLGRKKPTLEAIFKQHIWDALLKQEVNDVFNHPLQKILFLSLEGQPFIEKFLDEHYSHIQTKDTIKGILASLQAYGLAETRSRYLQRYKSRQTWYNYLKRLGELQNNFDVKALNNLTNLKIHSYILNQFGISTSTQEELGLNFNNQLSKNIDIKRCNT
ncbi:MAG: hypothetical protein HOE19_01575 [Candidatus Komeilibacteria bacterium]|jgi:hypothetical protein|nr:hypothetical protein [Candidatus Komeilibacteria bacterium]MBT4447528.1 hypothetical protein [Candidatus Komeilibacteria bacterium]